MQDSSGSYYTSYKKIGDSVEDPEKYMRLVGKLNYFTMTHPYIAYAVNVLSQLMSAPTTINNLTTLRQILFYLKGAPGLDVL